MWWFGAQMYLVDLIAVPAFLQLLHSAVLPQKQYLPALLLRKIPCVMLEVDTYTT